MKNYTCTFRTIGELLNLLVKALGLKIEGKKRFIKEEEITPAEYQRIYNKIIDGILRELTPEQVEEEKELIEEFFRIYNLLRREIDTRGLTQKELDEILLREFVLPFVSFWEKKLKERLEKKFGKHVENFSIKEILPVENESSFKRVLKILEKHAEEKDVEKLIQEVLPIDHNEARKRVKVWTKGKEIISREKLEVFYQVKKKMRNDKEKIEKNVRRRKEA
ncbi:MAG: hypothetical protein ABGX27_05885 [Desulfurobacteriaceae bacterium]